MNTKKPSTKKDDIEKLIDKYFQDDKRPQPTCAKCGSSNIQDSGDGYGNCHDCGETARCEY